jgi:outer membrane protein assembly factor BamE (lipoprotein component of BamABCDE complex)
MLRRRILVIAAVLAVSTVGAHRANWIGDSVSKRNAGRVEPGMTESQVEHILGPGQFASRFGESLWPDAKGPVIERVGDDCTVVVLFDENGKSVEARHMELSPRWPWHRLSWGEKAARFFRIERGQPRYFRYMMAGGIGHP